jgi:hypothetical protein
MFSIRLLPDSELGPEGELLGEISRFASVLYREGNVCFVQQQLSPDARFNDLLPRQTTTEDGERISEWCATTEAILQFVKPVAPNNTGVQHDRP